MVCLTRTSKIRRYDIPWNRKRDQAVFRGFFTGVGYRPEESDASSCQRFIRCRLVLLHGKSSLVDAKFTSLEGRLSSNVLQGVNLTAPHLNKEDLLLYKGLIMYVVLFSCLSLLTGLVGLYPGWRETM